jgi:integrase
MTGKNRRPKGDGALYYSKSKNLYIAEWHQVVGGIEKRFSTSGATEQQALERKTAKIRRLETGIITKTRQYSKKPSKKSPSIAMFMEEWLRLRTSIDPNTREKYRNTITLHVIPYIGQRTIRSITLEDIDQLFNSHLKDLKPAARWHTWTYLRTMLNYAVKLDRMKKNPMSKLDPPEKIIQVEEADDRLIDDRTATAMRLLAWMMNPNNKYHDDLGRFTTAFLGLRPGELLGLQREDIEQDNGYMTITIRHQLDVHGHQKIKPQTKTKNERTITVPEIFEQVIRVELGKQRTLKKPIYIEYKGGKRREAHNLWVRPDGALITPQWHGRRWYEALSDFFVYAGEEPLKNHDDERYFRPHYNRHICASLMAYLGIPQQQCQEVLGHLTPAMTKHYQHITNQHAETADKLNTSFTKQLDFWQNFDTESRLIREENEPPTPDNIRGSAQVEPQEDSPINISPTSSASHTNTDVKTPRASSAQSKNPSRQ